MSNIWLLLLSRVRVRRPRWFIPFVTVFAIGLIIAGLIYTYVVFQAVNTRSHAPHVHTHSTH
ncbi:MAG: hypothetical protein J0G35_10645 [Acidobacteriales bacterium]|nr:hypothetical protein [Terriglobales bacterium]